MSKQFYGETWKEIIQQGKEDRLRLCTQAPDPEHDIDEEEIEQNQYLWAGYIGDIGLR